jgi:hypothetical protein
MNTSLNVVKNNLLSMCREVCGLRSTRTERIVSDLLMYGLEIDYHMDDGIYIILNKENWKQYTIVAEYAEDNQLQFEYVVALKRYTLY